MGIWIRLVRKMANRYSAPIKYSVYLDSQSNSKFEGKIRIITVNYFSLLIFRVMPPTHVASKTDGLSAPSMYDQNIINEFIN